MKTTVTSIYARIKRHVCGKETDEATGCCSLTEYESTLQNVKGCKNVSLQQLLAMGTQNRYLGDHRKLWYVARVSTQRTANGERGEYVDLSGGYEWMGDTLFHILKLSLHDQHRVHLMAKEPKDANYCYDNL